MAPPKAQTIQQRFGFADDDLETPAHDEIMLDDRQRPEEDGIEIV